MTREEIVEYLKHVNHEDFDDVAAVLEAVINATNTWYKNKGGMVDAMFRVRKALEGVWDSDRWRTH